MCVAIIVVAYGVIFLFTHDENTKVFLAQSICDNFIFCCMFLVVAWLTGVSC